MNRPMALRVSFVNKTPDATSPTHVRSIGGRTGSVKWQHPLAAAIGWIEDRTFTYYVSNGRAEIEVVVALNPDGQKYLKTPADEDQPGSLLKLPESP